MTVQFSRTLLAAFAGTISTFAIAGAALAAGTHSGGDSHGSAAAFGEPGKAAEAGRTIEIAMGDNYFEPENLTVRTGETVRFVIRNEGEFLHEFNIGTAAMHAKHQEEMLTMMEQGVLTPVGLDHDKMKHGDGVMEHNDPNSLLLEPGQTAELIWKFSSATDLEFACNVPGHYESGMTGDIKFRKFGGAES